MMSITEQQADSLAKQFHEAYENAAPNYGYETREESRTNWEDVPERNKLVMRATMQALFCRTNYGKIRLVSPPM